ncbi:candidapepsin-4 precursor [Sporothrix schenckii 1099-18]|uniref:Candidapepsin-4 n=1 Tax=Sporothrix schenckii 1099-18 TaxID=1397361 RepID=A0A0F2MJI9_SPOSC|nr:candidapepsin-4 precursor [Sporothrix schenckii 1099-18]KJR89229.1 candidapepsin-4 precursor [Sporothrix schenckii 1099-18]
MALRLCLLLGVSLASTASAAIVDPSVISGSAPVPVSTVSAAVAAAETVDMQDGCIHFQIVHSNNAQHFTKRAVELSLANRSDVAYYAKLEFGTPPQAQYVQLDTGSFELWVNPTCSSAGGLSSGDANFCQAVGRFEPSASSTFTSLNVGKQLRYGIGTANITYVTDDISLPGTSSVLSQVQFGVATVTQDEFSGILGIGYGLGLTTRYPNFVDELAMQNVTRVKAFSLALGSKAEQEGVIVFGGVDTSKFSGQLERLPITPAKFSPDGVPRYWVNMTSLGLTPAGTGGAPKTYPNSKLQVFLDSGSTLTLLPSDLANAIAADFGAAAANSDGFYAVDCRLAATAGGSLDFTFGGTTVRVPYSELIRQSGSTCMLGLQASTDFVLLGDTFLRSAYVVIDQSDNVVWMAQYANCGSTPAALASAASLSTLTGVCTAANSLELSSGASASASATASTATGTAPARTATSAATPKAGTTSSSSSNSGATTSPAAAASDSAPTASVSRRRVYVVAGSVVAAMLGSSMLDWL